MDTHDMDQYIVSHLDEALEKGWISPYFQPIIRTVTNTFSGVEALARWKDPQYGTLMPGTFVPILEKTGLIYRVDCFILEKAAMLQRSRLDAGLGVGPISVNLSRQDFEMIDMAAYARRVLDQYHIRHDLIPLELTESLLVMDKEKMTSIVRELRSDGFSIWMDDFGSGYSSLSFLNDYTLDLIKLDMGFLKSFTNTSREIMKSSVHMAKNLGIRTLAEGVETEEHVRFLKEIGCDMMQGYYYSKPLSEQDMAEYMRHMNLPREAIEWKKFYDCADVCVTDSDVPRAVMEYDSTNDHIRYLYLNRHEQEQLRSIGRIHRENSEFILNARNNPLHSRLLEFYEKMIQSGEQAVLYVSDNSFFVRMEGKLVVRQEDRCIFLMSIINVTEERTQKIGEVLSKSISDIMLLFDDVHVLNPEKDTADNLINNFGIEGGLKNHDPLRKGLKAFCAHMIFPQDRERYRAFADPDSMVERIRQTTDGIY
ncbi:MAG: EAL domain-containing protein, partial [Bilifractor sp.]